MKTYVIPINTFAKSTRKQIREQLEQAGFNYGKAIITEVKGDRVYFEQEELESNGAKESNSKETILN